MAICFAETDVRPMGRDAAGVRGIRLDDGDEVVSAAVAAESKSLLTVTENGYGKRTAVEAYLRGEDRQPQTRGGKGLRNYRLTGKTGLVAGAAIVWPPAAFFSGGALLIALGLLLGQAQRGGDGK